MKARSTLIHRETRRRGSTVWLGVGLGALSTVATSCSPRLSNVSQPHEQLQSVLWVRTSAEYHALAAQTYVQAAAMLDSALSDPDWTAAVEQSGEFGALPPAVILDVDETVLDNSAYQARLILEDATYTRESWNAWCRERAATPVPGALQFIRHAEAKGVRVFYVTNRRAEVEEDTRANLKGLGFPVSDNVDTLLTRAEREEWSGSDKTSRQLHLASDYRILLLIGDNLGDFLGDVDTTPERRLELLRTHQSKWGRQWIVLPNPQYGSWESSLLGNEALTRDDALRAKRRHLNRQ